MIVCSARLFLILSLATPGTSLFKRLDASTALSPVPQGLNPSGSVEATANLPEFCGTCKDSFYDCAFTPAIDSQLRAFSRMLLSTSWSLRSENSSATCSLYIPYSRAKALITYPRARSPWPVDPWDVVPHHQSIVFQRIDERRDVRRRHAELFQLAHDPGGRGARHEWSRGMRNR